VSAKPSALTLLTFNILFDGGELSPESAWEHRRDLCAAVIRSRMPDVIGLQEALRLQLRDLADRLPEYTIVGHQGDEAGEWSNCTAILYRSDRLQVDRVGTFWLSETPDVPESKSWGSEWAWRCTWARFRSGGRPFWVFNLHAGFHVPELVHAGPVILRQVWHLTQDEATALMGDFNAPPESAIWKLLTGWIMLDGVRGDFEDAWLATGHDDHDPEQSRTFHGLGVQPPEGRIDWILFRGPWESESAEIVRWHQNGRYPSDHYPVLACFRFWQRSAGNDQPTAGNRQSFV